MAEAYSVIGVFISAGALTFLVVGASTNQWAILSGTGSDFNPSIVYFHSKSIGQFHPGNATSQTSLSYTVSHFGLWLSCHVESRGAHSCAFVSAKCYSNVCWSYQTEPKRSHTCLNRRVAPIQICIAYQLVRLFIVVALLFTFLGVCVQVTSVFIAKRSPALLAGIIMIASGVFDLVAVGIFYREECSKPPFPSAARIGWSFYLVIASAPTALIGGIVSCFSACTILRAKEVPGFNVDKH